MILIPLISCYKRSHWIELNPVQMGLFGAAQTDGGGGQKWLLSLKFVTHILQ